MLFHLSISQLRIIVVSDIRSGSSSTFDARIVLKRLDLLNWLLHLYWCKVLILLVNRILGDSSTRSYRLGIVIKSGIKPSLLASPQVGPTVFTSALKYYLLIFNMKLTFFWCREVGACY